MCGAIHGAAGPELAAVSATLGGCPTGSAKVTPAFDLPARWVAHAVGPIWEDGQSNEPELLAACYAECLRLAQEYGARSISFPAISTGIYGFPLEQATDIVFQVLTSHSSLDIQVNLLCFSPRDLEVYTERHRTAVHSTESQGTSGHYTQWMAAQSPTPSAATADSWTTLPMSSKRTEFSVNKLYSDSEMKAMYRGLIPQEMEDKWFIYWSDDTLFFHRSWSGHCIYQARFEGSMLTTIVACRDHDIFTGGEDESDRRAVLQLIQYGLLTNP